MGIKSSDNFPPPETFCTCASCFQCSERHYCKGKKLLLCVLFKILVHLGYFWYQPKSSPSRWVANWHVPLKGRQCGAFPGAPNPCVDVASGHLSTHRTELLLACSQCNQVNLNVFKLLMHWLIDFNNALTTTFNYCTSCYLRSHFGQRDVITRSEIIINGTTW